MKDKRRLRCRNCYIKFAVGKNSSNFKTGKSTNNKCTNCGINIFFSANYCEKCYHILRKIGKHLPNCIDCDKKLSTYKVKRCRSCAMKGKFNYNYGKIAKHGNGEYYNKIFMRSSYEIVYAKYLDNREIKWLYEPKVFILKENNTYTPDFYLPESNTYIEVKGWWRDKAKKKFKEFKKLYSTLKIEILDKKKLIKKGVKI
jgi:hypothetical protein